MADYSYREYPEYGHNQEVHGGPGGYYTTPAVWAYNEYWQSPGPYTGVGPRGYSRSDQQINNEVCERLAQNGQLDASDIEVTTENGEVTLVGNVDSRRDKRQAQDIADSVYGVTDVHNQLHIYTTQPTEQQAISPNTAAATTPELKRRKTDRLRVGMEVIGAFGRRIGPIRQIHQNDILVSRDDDGEIRVPFQAIQQVTNKEVVLTVPADQLDMQNWSHI